MTNPLSLNLSEIRQALAAHPGMRARDLAEHLGVGEAALVAAQVGAGATPITADPNVIMPAFEALGPVMSLTRNASAVLEQDGIYEGFHPGDHAAMVLTADIDLRIFPRHWVHAFAVETPTDTGPRRSLQFFDAAGDAVHKVYLRDGSNEAAWQALIAAHTRDPDGDLVALEPRAPVEAPKADPDKRDILRREWARMTDTHQFIRLVSRLKMNRLGAYRIVGAPFAKPLAARAFDDALIAVAADAVPIMLFVGNRGCISIHSGAIKTLKRMGPWQNVLDPGFNLHLRADQVAEVWAVQKPTKRGMTPSLEAFDADGALIAQLFAYRKEGVADSRDAFSAMIETLPAELETTL
ncbi:MAG: ChuX/HutX family heme-like substrate-binding protein [Pseudomonadota bacterium]